jgi:hypothetical protein
VLGDSPPRGGDKRSYAEVTDFASQQVRSGDKLNPRKIKELLFDR